MANVIHVTEENFQQEVIDSQQPVLADFWAPWCGHCTNLSPILDELAADMGDQIKVVKINVDENRTLAQRYSVMSLPTMILIKNGEKVEKLMGFMPKANLRDKIQPLL